MFVVWHLSGIHITGMLPKMAKDVLITGWQFPEAKRLSSYQAEATRNSVSPLWSWKTPCGLVLWNIHRQLLPLEEEGWRMPLDPHLRSKPLRLANFMMFSHNCSWTWNLLKKRFVGWGKLVAGGFTLGSYGEAIIHSVWGFPHSLVAFWLPMLLSVFYK